MRLSCSRAAVVSAVAALLLVGCSGSSNATGAAVADGGTEEDAAARDGSTAVDQDCSGLASSQSVSQPCCLARGIDACGANLFCAAFDGRKQPTCYVERSRLDMTECTADRQCTSGGCNVEQGKCRSTPGAMCSETLGCASVGGKRSVCVGDRCTTTDGKTRSPCSADADCTNGTCSAEHRCVGKAGATCTQGSSNECGASLCCKGTTCADCRGGVGEACAFFLPDCQPGLVCCPFEGSGAYCYASCK